MIIWLASYPRSGNTFFRILLKHLYDQPTYTGFSSGDDVDRAGRGDLTGHTPLPERLVAAMKQGVGPTRQVLDELDREPRIYFIKTHRVSHPEVDHGHRAVFLVRDVRDALCSHVWYLADILFVRSTAAAMLRENPLSLRLVLGVLRQSLSGLVVRTLKKVKARGPLFRYMMSRLMRSAPETGAGPQRWISMNRTWMERPAGTTVLLRYEDLVADPVGKMRECLDKLGVSIQPTGDRFPSFDELKQVHGRFFRKGTVGGWRDELPADLEEQIWSITGAEMEARRYTR